MGGKMKKLKRCAMIVALCLLVFTVYVAIVNKNSKNMTYRQKVLKAVYPALMWFTKMTGSKTKALSAENKQPHTSFYHLTAMANNGSPTAMQNFEGKKVLIVNTASNCGYTNQYNELQQLQNEFQQRLVVIGFPANDFKEQEKGTDEEIAQFCKINFGVTFPLMKKSTVVKSAQQNQVFKWLTDSTQNGWNNQPPSWNFAKYLINENGQLTHYFDPSVSPVSNQIKDAVKK
jgi:glutathione peroxidase